MMVEPGGINGTTIAAFIQLFALGFSLVGFLSFLYIPYVLYQLNKKTDIMISLLQELNKKNQ